ncbi:MAG: glycoside hydrolase family 3 C-terminal domain-containing protein [Cyclobacteriaceae bacterium]|nr:glycoside hydrolase family 3 C-terminal domain-containing protein [Cyclobacteriaceae bacterium]
MNRFLKNYLGLLAFWTIPLYSYAQTPGPAYLNPALSIQERAGDLVSKMSLQEKISQMRYDAPAIDRLGIPAYNWWNECLHGVGRAGIATVFPQAIGMAASFNEPLMFHIATAISDEARAKHHKYLSLESRNIYQGLTFWTPNINIFRDPRWGRGQETYGEDPFLTGRMAVNFIKGLQGDDPRHLKLVATAKHFAVHSGPESTRHSINVNVSERDLRETYLPAFKLTVKESGVASIMCAYNRFRDEACCGSNLLLKSVLRDEWNFDGYVVSDCWAIRDFFEPDRHGVSATASEAAALAVRSGTDLNCGNVYDPYLMEAVEKGQIAEAEIDQALVRLFAARFRLGMFDQPENVRWASIPYDVVGSEKHRQLALQSSRESIVLLKNSDKILPISKEVSKLAVIGPNADDYQVLLGNYHGTSKHMSTVLEAIRNKVSDQTRIYYAQGSEPAKGVTVLKAVPSTALYPSNRDATSHGLYGEYFDNPSWEGTPAFTRVDAKVNFIWKDKTPVSGIMADAFSVRWTGFIKVAESGSYELGMNACNGAKLFIDDSLLLSFRNPHHPTEIAKAVELEAGRFYKVKIEMFSDGSDPQSHFIWGRPDEGNYEKQALEVAANADLIVAVMGLTPHLEGEEMPVKVDGFDGGDRTHIRLPEVQTRLLQKLHATGKPVVLVLLGGSSISIQWEKENLPAILHAWYPGEFGGDAIADVIFGDYNPSGRLPLTFYQKIEDLPDFEDYSMKGRTYRYFNGTPLYPFGYGQSYTQFTYSKMKLSPGSLQAGRKIQLSVEVSNAGARDGDEVVQVYIRRENAVEALPLRSLKAFRRINLKAGETRRINFELDPADFALANESGVFTIEPGQYSVSVGGGQPITAIPSASGLNPFLIQTLRYNGKTIEFP